MTFGMIANLELQEIVLYSMIRKIDHILGFGAVMYFTVPLDMTAVEKRAYFHVANGHWLKKNRVFMVEAISVHRVQKYRLLLTERLLSVRKYHWVADR